MNRYTIDNIDELGPLAAGLRLASATALFSPTDVPTVPRFKRHS